MIIVTGIAEIAPESVDGIKQAASVMAEASRKEPGCEAYAFYEDIEQAGRFRIFEKWQTADALRSHFSTPHMKEFNANLGKARVLKLEIEQFERGVDVTVNS